MRKKFVTLCKEELQKNPKSFVLLGDIGVGGFLDQNDQLPDRVMNMGIAEQSMVGFAAGLASSLNGNVILHTISPFLVERAFEQIKLCCGYNEAKLILISANGPFDYEKLGPTHHCPADIDILSTLPNIELRLPATVADLSEIFYEAVNSSKSFYIRMTSRSSHLPINPLNDGEWKKIYFIDGEFSIKKPETQVTGLVCIGESLAYCISKFKAGNYVIYWTSSPDSVLPNSLSEVSSIKIFEPYLRPHINLGINTSLPVTRKNFKIENKKIILNNLGWEDFDE